MKKAFLLTLLVLFALCIFPFPAYALTDGDFDFEIISGTHNCTITKYNGSDTDVVIPATLSDGSADYTVTVIGSDSFNHNTAIQSVFIPKSVVEIDESAFGYTYLAKGNIESVTFEDGSHLETIGENAFAFNKIVTLTIPGSVKTIDRRAFYYSPITSLVLEEGIEYIGEASFDYHMLPSLHIPASVTYIGEEAFTGSTDDFNNYPLTSVTFAEGSRLETIDESAFAYNNITSIEFPDMLTEIGKDAFEYNKIVTLTIPGNVKKIGSYAFYNNLLSTLTLEEGIEIIDDSAFEGHYLSELTIPASVIEIGDSAFYGEDLPDGSYPLSKLTFSQGSQLKIIKYAAFSYNNLSEIDLPLSVTTIKPYAFSHNNLSQLNLSTSITSIEYDAFRFNNLSNVTLPSSLTHLGSRIFESNPMTQFQLPYHDHFGTSGYWKDGSGSSHDEGDMIDTSFNKELDLVLSADSYSVTLDNRGIAANSFFFIAYEHQMPDLAPPSAQGYVFGGYFTQTDGQGDMYYSSDMSTDKSWDIQDDGTLYALWYKSSYNVYFNSQGGSQISTQSVEYGEHSPKPANPTKNGYVFAGWYTESSCSDASIWDFDVDIVTGEMTLYAKWTEITVTGISLNTSELTLRDNETSKLIASLKPFDANKRIYWVSSDNSIATVSQSGVVYGEGKGSCVITASSMGYLATCSVEVKPKHVSSVLLTPSSYTMYVGQMIAVNADVSPSNATYRTVSWKSSDNDVATVTDEGIVEAYGAGTCTITATADGVSDTCKITVTSVPLSDTPLSVFIKKSSVPTLYVGDMIDLLAHKPSFFIQQNPVAWLSSDESVATVTQTGRVTAIGVGEVTISASSGAQSDTYSIKVIEREQSPDSPTEKQDGSQTEIREVTLVDFDTTILPDGTKYVLLPCGETLELTGGGIMRIKVPCNDVDEDGNIEFVALDDERVPLGSVIAQAAGTDAPQGRMATWLVLSIAFGAIIIGAGGTLAFIKLVLNRR